MVRVVIALDRDGTVETGVPRGVIPLSLIFELKKRDDVVVYAYGNIALSGEAGIPYAEGSTKEERLRWLMEKYPEAQEYIVIDDQEIHVEGWRYYTPQAGLEKIRELLGIRK